MKDQGVDGQFGRDMSEDQLQRLSDEQKEQLTKLQVESLSVFENVEIVDEQGNTTPIDLTSPVSTAGCGNASCACAANPSKSGCA